MGTQRVRYYVMTKPIHPAYNVVVPGLGRQKEMPPNINITDTETLYFKETLKSCSYLNCSMVAHKMELEPWMVFEVCYSIEECARAVKRALFAVGEENIRIFQDVPASLHIKL